MKFYFLFFIFVFLSLHNVVAVGFSPSSLKFNLQENEESCQTITLSGVTDRIGIINVWAENFEVDWKINNFDSNASEHGLELTYSINDKDNGKEVEVCLSGSKVGEYHGAIIFRQEQEGTSIVQLAIWLKAVIKEKPKRASQLINTNSDSRNSGVVGGRSLKITTTPIKETDNKTTKDKLEFEAIKDEFVEESPTITESTVDKGKSGISFWSFAPYVFIVLVVVGSVHVYIRKKRLAKMRITKFE